MAFGDQTQQQNNPWMTGPLVQLPQTQSGMGQANPNQQPSYNPIQPTGPLGQMATGIAVQGIDKGINAGVSAAQGTAATDTAAAVAGEGVGASMMTGLATAAPWLAAGYLGGRALRLFNRGTSSVDFGSPADPFGFARGGFINPYMQKRQQPISPNQQPMTLNGEGFPQGMVKNTAAPLTVKAKGIPKLHDQMVRPGGEV